MDKFEKAIVLMKKWNSDEGATNEELLELKECLKAANDEVEAALKDRMSDEA